MGLFDETRPQENSVPFTISPRNGFRVHYVPVDNRDIMALDSRN